MGGRWRYGYERTDWRNDLHPWAITLCVNRQIPQTIDVGPKHELGARFLYCAQQGYDSLSWRCRTLLILPVNDDDDVKDNDNLPKLAVQEKYDIKDLLLLTKVDVAISMHTAGLKHHMKNISKCAGKYFGEVSIIHTGLKLVSNHIEKKYFVHLQVQEGEALWRYF